MKIHFAYFALSLLLLLLPRQVLRLGAALISGSRNRKHTTNPRDRREPGDHALRAGEEFRKSRNYLDFMRAAAGSVCLIGVSVSAPDSQTSTVHLLEGVVITLALLVQTLRFGERLALYAPVFFIAGLNVGTAGVLPAILGFALAWVLNPLLTNPALFLAALGIFTTGFQVVFEHSLDGSLAVPLLVAALPIAVSAIVRRPLTGLRRRVQT